MVQKSNDLPNSLLLIFHYRPGLHCAFTPPQLPLFRAESAITNTEQAGSSRVCDVNGRVRRASSLTLRRPHADAACASSRSDSRRPRVHAQLATDGLGSCVGGGHGCGFPSGVKNALPDDDREGACRTLGTSALRRSSVSARRRSDRCRKAAQIRPLRRRGRLGLRATKRTTLATRRSSRNHE